MIDLLFIAKDTSNLIDKNYCFLEQELAKLTNLTVWRSQGAIQRILKQIPLKPDFILIINDMGKQMTPTIKGLSSINIPSGLIVNDIHRFTELRRQNIRSNKFPHIFSVVRDAFHETYPEYSQKVKWLPHFVQTDIYKDYGLKKDIDLLMMGAVNEVYPIRKKILESYQSNSHFVYHPHPGYDELLQTDNRSLFIGEKYAKEMNKAKIFFTCPSIYHYPVKKYYEALASKTLLLAPTFKEIEDLGFVPGTHFVSIDENNYKEKASYFLANEVERNKITEQGYQFVHQTHSAAIRARQLVETIESIL